MVAARACEAIRLTGSQSGAHRPTETSDYILLQAMLSPQLLLCCWRAIGGDAAGTVLARARLGACGRITQIGWIM